MQIQEKFLSMVLVLTTERQMIPNLDSVDLGEHDLGTLAGHFDRCQHKLCDISEGIYNRRSKSIVYADHRHVSFPLWAR